MYMWQKLIGFVCLSHNYIKEWLIMDSSKIDW